VLASLCIVLMVLLCGFTVPLCAKEPPESAPAEDEFFSGCNLLSQDHVSEAVPALEKAVQLDPENPKYRQVLAVAYNNCGLRLAREGNVRDGVLFLAKALNVVPENNDIQHNFVQTVLQAVSAPEEKIKLEEKTAYLKEVLEIEPKNEVARKTLAILLNNWGVANGRTGDHEEEMAQLEQASSLDPKETKIKKNLANAYYNVARIKGKAGNFQDEASLLRRALELTPDDQTVIETLARALSNLAVVKAREGDIQGQISFLKESLDLVPGDAVTKTNLAAAYNNYAMTKNSELTMAQRIAHLELSLELDPANQISKSNYTNLLVQEAIKEAKRGFFKKAVELREKAAKVAHDDRRIQIDLVAVHPNESPKKGGEGKRPEEPPDPPKKLSTCRLLNEYLERFVHICSKSTDADVESRLASLKTHHRNVIEQMKSAGLDTALVNYEQACRCVNRSINSGTALKVIYSGNLCGTVSTKQLRTNIVNKCRGSVGEGSRE